MPSGATRRQKAGSRQLAAAKASSGIGRRSGGPRRARRAPWRRAPRGRAARRRAAAAAVGVVGDRRAPAGGRAGAGAAGPEDEGAQRDGREGLAHGAGVERRVCGRGAADDAAQEGEPPRGACPSPRPNIANPKLAKRVHMQAPTSPSRPREPSLPGQCERSDHRESTDTRQLIEVKPYRARLVLRWVTTLESRVALSFLFATFAIFFCPPAPCAPPGPSSLHAKRSRKSGRRRNSSEEVSRAAFRPASAGDELQAKP